MKFDRRDAAAFAFLFGRPNSALMLFARSRGSLGVVHATHCFDEIEEAIKSARTPYELKMLASLYDFIASERPRI